MLLTSALWGGTPVAISFSVVNALPPVAVAGWRFALAACFMVVWCRIEGSSLVLRRGQWRPALIAGCILFFQISLFNLGVAWSNSSHGSMLINTFIFWVVGIEHFVTRAIRLNGIKLFGLVVAASGAFLLLVESQAPGANDGGDAPSRLGDAILLLSALVLGIKIVYIKQSLTVIEPSKLIFWHDVVGVVLFATYSFSFEQVDVAKVSVPAVLAILYQGILVAGFCFAVQARLLRKHSATQISVFSFTTPLFGVCFAILLRGDPLSPWLLVAAACIAAGILLVNWTSRTKSAAT